MICKPCRYGDHEQCPESARQFNTALTDAERSCSSRCDCGHQPRRIVVSPGDGSAIGGLLAHVMPETVRSATLANPKRATQ